MRLTLWGATAAVVAVFIMQGGAQAQMPGSAIATPTPPGAGPNWAASPTPMAPASVPMWSTAPSIRPGGGGGLASTAPLMPSYGPMLVPVPGGNPNGIDAVPTTRPSGGGGGGGQQMNVAPAFMGPNFIQFNPPGDNRGHAGPAGTTEPTLGPGSPRPR